MALPVGQGADDWTTRPSCRVRSAKIPYRTSQRTRLSPEVRLEMAGLDDVKTFHQRTEHIETPA
jgi:hypothetical protein